MPNCFTLKRIGEDEPSYLQDVDAEICKHLEIECDEKKWAFDWFNSIGFMLAFGRDLTYIRNNLDGYFYEDDLLKICDFLEKNYTSDSFYSHS